MPKASPLQPSFSGGEFGPKVLGRVDSERYKTGCAVLINYLPTTQGPLVRRPGNKRIVDVKDASKPPALYEFKFSQQQNYVLEFGERYIRFHAREAQITTTSTHFKVSGNYGTVNVQYASSNFYAMRSTPLASPNEAVLASSVILASSVLEIESPYAWSDIQKLKIAQKDDTLYLVNSNYPEYKLIRFGHTLWDLKKINSFDGPYLPLNSYRAPGDQIDVSIITDLGVILIYPDLSSTYSATTGPIRYVNNITNSPGSTGPIIVTVNNHGLTTGNKVVVRDVLGAVEANNGTSTIQGMYWPIKRIDANTFELVGSPPASAWSGSGRIYPAVFEPYNTATEWNDIGRPIGLVRPTDAGRTWGTITQVHHMHLINYHVDSNNSPIWGAGSSVTSQFWYLGVWNRSNKYPNAITMHQDRQFLSGTPQYPGQIDASVIGEYENFQSSGSSFTVSDNNAIQRTLASSERNPIFWLRSDANGLLAGARDAEWKISPDNQAGALTPTNFNAAKTSAFGSNDSDSVQTGNGTIYIQNAKRRIRELNYFFQVDTYRSTDLADLADHLTGVGVEKLSVQKEFVPVVYGLRTDGQIINMAYGRDDVSLKVGWCRTQLGGRSDSGGSLPKVKSVAVVPSPDGSYDQAYMVVQRFINGTSVVSIECAADVYKNEDQVENAKFLDCSGTYDNPLTITNISIAAAAQVSVTAHGLADGDYLLIKDVVGLNSSFIDGNGVVYNSNLVNRHTFVACSTAAANSFFLKDFDGNDISSLGYSTYVSDGQVRKLVSTISGATWLKNETISVLADGRIHPDVTVNSAGVFVLTFPAATVHFGYRYNSDLQTLRPDAGSGDGTSIGKLRRAARVALMIHQVGEMSIGPSFVNLTPLSDLENFKADFSQADQPVPLFSGIVRDGVESGYDFEGQTCVRQSAPLPGMIQTYTAIMETNDV